MAAILQGSPGGECQMMSPGEAVTARYFSQIFGLQKLLITERWMPLPIHLNDKGYLIYPYRIINACSILETGLSRNSPVLHPDN